MKTDHLFSMARLLLFVFGCYIGWPLYATTDDTEDHPSSRLFSSLTQSLQHGHNHIPSHRRLAESWTDRNHAELARQAETLEECTQAILHKWPGLRGQRLIDLAAEYMIHPNIHLSFSRLMDLLDTFCAIEEQYPNTLLASYTKMIFFYEEGKLPHWAHRQRCLHMTSYLLTTTQNIGFTHIILEWFYELTHPDDHVPTCNTFFSQLYNLTQVCPQNWGVFFNKLQDSYSEHPLEAKLGYLQGILDSFTLQNLFSSDPFPTMAPQHPEPGEEEMVSCLKRIVNSYKQSLQDNLIPPPPVLAPPPVLENPSACARNILQEEHQSLSQEEILT
ncbi:MAG: hypothetical protein ACK5PQ_00510 [Alphaproteobacteria bacterium]